MKSTTDGRLLRVSSRAGRRGCRAVLVLAAAPSLRGQATAIKNHILNNCCPGSGDIAFARGKKLHAGNAVRNHTSGCP